MASGWLVPQVLLIRNGSVRNVSVIYNIFKKLLVKLSKRNEQLISRFLRNALNERLQNKKQVAKRSVILSYIMFYFKVKSR